MKYFLKLSAAASLLLLLLMLSCFSAYPQVFSWARLFNVTNHTNANASARAIAVDGSGNVYSAGAFFGTLDIDPGVGETNLIRTGTNQNQRDLYVSKLNASGNLAWGRHIEIAGSFEPSACTFDSVYSALYVTGRFSGTADFDPGPGILNITSAGMDVFVIRFDADGNFIWVKTMGGTAHELAYGLETDLNGDVYISGSFMATADFDPGAGIASLSTVGGNNSDGFLCKLSSGGTFSWVRHFVSTGLNSTTIINRINIDQAGNIILAAVFGGTTDFDPGAGVQSLTYSYTGISSEDIAIVKLDASGNFTWVKHISGNDNESVYALQTDASGSIYLAGTLKDSVDFDPGSGTFIVYGAHENYSAFACKLSSSGDLVWVKNINCSSAESMALDASGQLVITGTFHADTDFDPGSGMFWVPITSQARAFIWKLDNAGNFLWAGNTGGLTAYAAAGGTDDLYITGNIKGTNDVDPGTGVVTVNATGMISTYVTKFTGTSLPVKLTSFTAAKKQATVLLGWITASEVGLDRFVVERSANGSDFTELLNIQGSGDRETKRTYSAIDTKPLNGLNYYRLTSVDRDGSVTYSKTLAVNMAGTVKTEVYPNPASGHIYVSTGGAALVSVRIYDICGTLKLQQDSSSDIDLSHLASGVYYLEAHDGVEVTKHKILKQ